MTTTISCLFSKRKWVLSSGLLAVTFMLSHAIAAESEPQDATNVTSDKPARHVDAEEPAEKTPPKLAPPAGATAMPGSKAVWIDREKKRVYVDGQVTLRRGLLEMFACPKGTKEHESVVSVNSRAYMLHTALLMVGAKSGKPVKYIDEYIAPSGDVIEISVEWLDPQGKKHTTSAKNWVRDAKTNKAMGVDWVFAGSGFWVDEETGKKHYKAEGGDLICVANFSTAMLDVAVKSTQANDGLVFEAFTENVPALGTPIRLVLTPKKAAKKAE